MEEGIFPPNPGMGVPNQQNPWGAPSPANSNKDFAGNYPTVSPESVRPQNVNPVIYRSDGRSAGAGSGNAGQKPSRSLPIKKILLAILGIVASLTIVVIIFIMFSSGVSEKPTSEGITLTYWGVFEDEGTIRPVLNEFEKENPNIKISYEKQDVADYKEKLIARTKSGKAPDVFWYHNTWYPTISDILLPIPSDVIEKKDFESRYYNVAKNDLIKKGTIYGIPLYTDTLSLYINTDLYATDSASAINAPKTWQEFIDASAALTKRDDRGAISVAGAGIGTYENVDYAPDILSLLIAQNGADPNNPSDYKKEITDAITFYTNFALVEDNVWDSSLDDTRSMFAQGKLAMFFGYSWDYAEIKAKNPNIKMIVVPVPQLISDKPVNIASYWAEGVSVKASHPKEAFLFTEYLARSDVQVKLFEEAKKSRDFGEPYSIVSLIDKLKDTPAYVFADQSRSAMSSPFVEVKGTGNLNSEVNKFLEDAVNSVLNRGEKGSAIDALIGGYSQTVGQYFNK